MTEATGSPQERAFMVGVEPKGRDSFTEDAYWPAKESLAELERLARTAGMVVVGYEIQQLMHPHPATFIGPGKAEEIAAKAAEKAANVVLFDDELSPRHQRELEEILGEDVKVLDRTALILDIFAQHAHTREGSLQVELAQYEYRLPRLTRAWTHLARQAGGRAGGATGSVGVRGPGESQLETDRRMIRRRITQLKDELERVRAHRKRYRTRRRRAGMPTVALVGYTNAGKSTLLNALAHADVLVADQLFATLDPTTRRVELPGGGSTLFTDTVGFIQKLPTQLVAAFHATLEEISEADLLVHVMDITHPQMWRQARAVEETLETLRAARKPMISALNKIDLLPSADAIPSAVSQLPNPVAISALTGEGLPRLLTRIEEMLEAQMAEIDVLIPYDRGELVDLFHRRGLIQNEEHTEEGTHIAGLVPRKLVGRFQGMERAAQRG
ncbi:MAG: GTPase HflX [Chloroflexota bacterium]